MPAWYPLLAHVTSVQKGGESSQAPLELGEGAKLGFLASGNEQASVQQTLSISAMGRCCVAPLLVTVEEKTSLPLQCLVRSLGNRDVCGPPAQCRGGGQ